MRSSLRSSAAGASAITRQSSRSTRATAAMAARLPVATENSRITIPASVSSTTLEGNVEVVADQACGEALQR